MQVPEDPEGEDGPLLGKELKRPPKLRAYPLRESSPQRDCAEDCEAMKKIDSYRFGQVEIEGQTYLSDLIIYPDRIDAHWWRKEGHSLHLEDLSAVAEARPDLLLVGTGRFGMMRIPQETKDFLASLGIALLAEDTEKACETFNRLRDEKKVVFALHLTC